jgi:hypothetical protein
VLPREKSAYLQILQGRLKDCDTLRYLLQKDLAPLFREDARAFLQIREPVFKFGKGREGIFKGRLLFLKFLQFLVGGPDFFLGKIRVYALNFLSQGGNIKDTPLGIPPSP